MKKTIIAISLCLLSGLSFAGSNVQTNSTRRSAAARREAASTAKTQTRNDLNHVMGKATVKRLEAIASQRRLQSRVVTNDMMICTYVQAGRTWQVTNRLFRATGFVKPPRYSRLKLFVAVSQIGKWEDLETWLKSQNVNGMNAWTAFMLANDLAADNEMFILWAGRAREALGVDEETFNAILKASED